MLEQGFVDSRVVDDLVGIGQSGQLGSPLVGVSLLLVGLAAPGSR